MTKWTTADIPDQTGRTAVITGANTGLGYETAAALAAKGAHVVLAVRNLDKGKEAARGIKQATPDAQVELQELDLSSLESIRCAADQLRSDYPAIDLLINNAGVGMPPKSNTRDGFELQFGTNHLGHFALTNLLLDRLLAAPGSRIVTVSSQGHRFARSGIRFDDLQWDQSYSRAGSYGQSKLANLMFTYELQRRLIGTDTIAVAAHPGSSKTELDRNAPPLIRLVFNAVGRLFHDADMAALPTLRAATDPGVLGGQYFGPHGFAEQRGYPKVVTSSDASHDTVAQHRLWAVSEELTGVVHSRRLNVAGRQAISIVVPPCPPARYTKDAPGMAVGVEPDHITSGIDKAGRVFRIFVTKRGARSV